MSTEINVVEVGDVMTERKDGTPLTDNDGNPSVYFTVGFAAPYQPIRRRNVWGRVQEDGTIRWEMLSPERAKKDMNNETNLAQHGVRLESREIVPIEVEEFDNPITNARLLIFPHESETQALKRLYGADAEFMVDTNTGEINTGDVEDLNSIAVGA